jgi:hypothetical protein
MEQQLTRATGRIAGLTDALVDQGRTHEAAMRAERERHEKESASDRKLVEELTHDLHEERRVWNEKVQAIEQVAS